ncbi:MAG: peptidoglycan-binding protein [Marinobacter sp.]|uniref:peptidoglycan-binding domain-containing protein n=1 Tax=Marinobacter sp. TaxID=50741 RepID=UPI003299EA21
MSQSRFNRAPGITAVAVLASFCAVDAQAGPVETIYSAENALYGAGHDIGKADGWIDNTLRAAIRRYQSGNDGLEATGNLDPQTLSALGIIAEGNGTISDNSVSDRESAMTALGLSVERLDRTSVTRPVVAAAEPAAQPEPEPEPEPEAVSRNEVETQPEPPVAVSSASEQSTLQSEPAPANPEVAPFAPEKAEEAVIEQPVTVSEVVTTEPDPAPEPIPEPEQAMEAEEPGEPEEKATVEVAAAEEPPESDFQLPEEPTSAGPAKVSELSQAAESPTPPRSEPTAQSSGGFFSSLFDFLFGWLI